MTGFAEKTITMPVGDQNVIITLSIKSLNARFFEATCRLPYALSTLEIELNQRFKKALKRGNVFFAINLSNGALLKGTVEPALSVIKSYLDAVATIQSTFNLPGAITIQEVIQLPNVFSSEEKALDDHLKTFIMTALDKLLEQLIEARKKEGAVIKKDFEQRCTVLEHAIKSIEKEAEELMAQRKEQVGQNLQTLSTTLPESTLEAQRALLYQELNKIDIHEEIVRFKSHLANMKLLLTTSDIEKGKRLDFTLQELTREINTIAAKSSEASTSSIAITIKVELEKIREQAQNVV
jgi:uncharacterized protein (TIGR00255 family)